MSLGSIQAANRKIAGSAVTVGGVKTVAIVEIDTGANDFLPDGSRNAANANNLIFNVTPADFTASPAEGASVLWHGTAYTITGCDFEDYAGETISYVIRAYRAPQAATSTQDAAQDAVWDYPTTP